MQENPQGPPNYGPSDPLPAAPPPQTFGQAGAPIPTPGAPVASGAQSWDQYQASGFNTSGTGATAVLPEELKGFNWGAFLLNWIWSIAHNSYIGLIALIPYVGFVMAIVLGFKGNEWAWQNRKWDSVEHFRATQKVWTKWGVGIILVSIVLSILFSILAASMMRNLPTTTTATTTTIPSQ